MSELDGNAIQKLTKDLKNATLTLTDKEARYLVDTYYLIQDQRKRSANQIRALSELQEPHEVLEWLSGNTRALEGQIKKALDVFSASKEIGVWARNVVGIGPVIAAGLMAHIDIEKAHTAGAIWRYAGLDPTCRWLPKQKRPWNASLKTLCWKIGESFVKVSGNPDSLYGRLYSERKAYETINNQNGLYRETAALGAERVGKSTEAYKFYSVGLLPPGHLHARAKRYAVKIFLSHYHEKLFEITYGRPYPHAPYPIAHLGHVHKIEREVA